MSARSSNASPPGPAAEHVLLQLQRRAAEAAGESQREQAESPGLTERAAAAILEPNAPELSPENYQRHAAMLTLCRNKPGQTASSRPFESPNDSAIWAAVGERVSAAMGASGIALPVEPAVGILPTHAFEPLIILPAAGGAVIGIDPNAAEFLNLLGKAIAQLFLVEGDGGRSTLDFTPRDWSMVLHDDHPAVRSFVDMVLATSAGRSSWARPYMPAAAYEGFASELRDLAEFFLLGRALAHLSAGHAARASRAVLELPGSEVETPAFSLEDEFHADLLAFDLLVAETRAAKRPVAAALLAVESLLATQSILESAHPLIAGGPLERVVPPSASGHEVRQRAIRYVAGLHDATDGFAVDFVRSIQPAFEILWTMVEKALSDPEVADNVRRPGLCQRPWSQFRTEYDDDVERLARATALRHGTVVLPDDPGAWHRLGDALLEAGDIEPAVTAYQRVTDLVPDVAEAHLNLATSLGRAQRYDRAVAEYRRALALRPMWPLALARLSWTAHAGGLLDEARLAFRRWLEVCPSEESAWLGLVRVLTDLGDFQAVADALERATMAIPSSETLLSMGAAVLPTMGRHEAAVRVARRALGHDNERPTAWRLLGLGLVGLGREDDRTEAVSALSRIVDSDAAEASDMAALAHLALETENADVGLRAARRLTELNPEDREGWAFLSYMLREDGRLDDAIVAVRCALAIEEDPEELVNLSAMCSSIGRIDEGIDACRRATEIDPACGPAWANWSDLAGRQGRWGEALLHAERATETEPSDYLGWLNMGDALAHLGDLPRAADACKRALDLDPSDLPAWLVLGRVFHAAGRPHDARLALSRLRGGDPELARQLESIIER